jgi:ATP-binding cassette subfamily A (ABC1) protein 3
MELNNKAITWQNIDLMIDNYNLKTSLLFLTGHFFVNLILALYLDQVFPNEFGAKKHPLFFLPIFRKEKNEVHDIEMETLRKINEEPVDEIYL